MEGYSESKKQKTLEVKYLNSIRADLVKDTLDMNMVIDSTSVIINHLSEVFRFIGSDAPVSSYRQHHVTSAYLGTYFYPKNGTFVSLVNSGNLNLISDFELLTSLSDLYNVDYKQIERLDNVLKNLADNLIQPYMLKNITFNLDYTQDGILDAEPLKTNEAINLIGSYYNLINGRQLAYRGIIQKCDSLIRVLDKELSRKE